MKALREVAKSGTSSHLPFSELTSERAQILQVKLLTAFRSPSDDLAKYIAHVTANLASFTVPRVN